MKLFSKRIIGFLGVKEAKPRFYFFIAIVCLFLCISIVLSCVVVAQKSIIKTERNQSENSVKAGERIYINDNHLGQTWLAAIEGLEKNTYSEQNFVSDETFKYYKEDDKITSYCGVDVSSFQGEIDWEELKKQGVDFAMLRVGGRGYTEGDIYEDEMFETNAQNAHKAGIKVGAYFFSQALNKDEAIEEAQFVIDKISDYQIDYPVAFDWEIIGTSEARTDEVGVEELTLSAKAFCDEIEKAGYTPMIYSNDRSFYYKYDLSYLKGIDLWLVDYESLYPPFYYNYTMWQYTYTGQIDGVSGDVDINICFKDY